MRRNLATASDEAGPRPDPPPALDSRGLVASRLGYRGMEVLQNAESQFPNQTRIVVDKLAHLMRSGQLDEELDGGKLLALFRYLGINIRMDTKIQIAKDGKLVSISDKLGMENSDPS